MTRHNRLTLNPPAAVIEASDLDARTLKGVALPYGEQGDTSAGRVSIDAGAVRVPDNLRAVKLFREHGRTTPIGYALTATDGPDALHMTFHVAATDDGDRALLEAAEGVRDALSVELADVSIEAGRVTAATLVGVAQVAVPAFASAILTAALTDAEQADVNDLAQQIVDATAPEETDDTGDTAGDTDTDESPFEQEEAAMPEETTTTAGRPAGMTPPAFHPTRPPVSLAAAHIAEAMRGQSDASRVDLTAALADVHPGNAGTAGIFPRPAWLGELWSPQEAARPLINAIGVSPLTAMRMDGYKWVTKPVVSPYAGNKAEIPTSPAAFGPAQADAHRIAGGWDLDRIYVDFNTGMVEAFLAAAAQDYRKKSATYFLDGHAAITGPPAIPAAEGIMDDAHDLGAQADFVTALGALSAYLVGGGARMSFIGMAADVFADFLALPEADVPWWLKAQGTVSLDGSTTVAGITVGVDPGLTAGSMVAGDSAAVTLWETGPINVQAVNLPNGGVDLALFGYWAQMVHDPAGLAKATVTAPVGLTASRTTAREDDATRE